MADLKVVISALNQASGELRKVAGDLNKLDKAAQKSGGGAVKAATDFGKLNSNFGSITKTAAGVALGMGGLSASIGGARTALQGTVGAAIAFESSFAGIRKTVDETEAGFQQIAAANRQMAKELPTSVNEINRIGEAAGALGVSGVADLTKFERVMVDVANTTNLTSDEAATAFAQIANVLQLPIQNIDRLGSAIVDLGNKGASTEADIVAFAQRIAGAGKIAGLSAAEIAGIGSAFASVGVEAEAGGTAIQKVLIALRKAAVEGGVELNAFADAAGLTAEQFQQLARSDGAEAFTRFVEGLGKAGDDAFGILEQLGLEDQRLIRSFLSTAQAGDLLRRSIETGTTAFKQNNALTAEAEKRYATTASRLQVLKNNVTDVGISIGQQLLPAISDSAAVGTELVGAVKPLGPALSAVAKAAPLAAAGMVAFTAASKAANFAQLQGDLAVLTRAGFPNLAAQVRGNTSLMAGLGAAVKSPLGGFVALTGAVIGLDVAARKLTGFGLVDNLTGAARAAKEAARFANQYGDSLERIAARERAGISTERARDLEIKQRITDLRLLNKQISDLADTKTVNLNLKLGLTADLKRSEEDLERLTDQMKELGLTRDELKPLRESFKDDPAIFQILTDLLNEQNELLGRNAEGWRSTTAEELKFQRETKGTAGAVNEASKALTGINLIASELAKQYGVLEAAIKGVDDILSRKTPQETENEKLLAQTRAIIAEHERLGEDVPEELKKWEDQLTRNESAAQSLKEAASATFADLATDIRSSGVTFEGVVNDMVSILGALPQQQAIEIIAKADQFLGSAAEVQRFIELVKTNPQLSIDLLLRIAARSDEIEDSINAPRKLTGGFFAKGGFVDARKAGELAVLHGKELILPLDDKQRSMELLAQAGMRGFNHGGSRQPVAGLLNAGTPAPTYNIQTYITADSNASDATLRKLAGMVEDRINTAIRRREFGGANVSMNAFPPRNR